MLQNSFQLGSRQKSFNRFRSSFWSFHDVDSAKIDREQVQGVHQHNIASHHADGKFKALVSESHCNFFLLFRHIIIYASLHGITI